MTCIVALEADGNVWLGSDSFMGNATTRDLVDRPKWFRRGAMLVGFAGDFAPAQALERARFRRPKRGEPADAYLREVVAPRARKAFERSEAAESPTDFLIALDGHAFVIQSDWSVVRSSLGFTAIGAGQPYALGALAATPHLDPEPRVRVALAAAARLCPQVAEPFFVERAAS